MSDFFSGSGFYGDPGINPGSSSGGGQQTFDDIFKLLQLGTQTYLTNQAITNPRPATVTYLPNGQALVATGGGAVPPASVNFGSLFSNPLILVVLVIVVVLLLRH